MDNAPSGYKYPSIEMRKAPQNKIWWLIGLLVLAAIIFLLSKSNQNNPPVIQQTPDPSITSTPQPATPSATFGERTKTKFMWVNFPSNPTGQVITILELEKIVEFAKEHEILIVYDNAYSEITFDDYIAPSILQVDGAKDVAVEIGSFSKTFSFAGFRIGWIVGNSEVINALAKVKSQTDSGLSTPLQKLGAFALNNLDEGWYEEMITSYKKRRDVIARKLKLLGLSPSLPKGSLYIWAKIPLSAKNSEEYCMQLLENKQILLTPGTAFGKNGERYVRVSICINIDNIEDYF